MKLVFLDAGTVGQDVDIQIFKEFGDVVSYEASAQDEIGERIAQADIVLTHKCKLDEQALSQAPRLKLISEAATGYDNIDIDYAEKHGIAVCNVEAYSTDSVAQITVSTVLDLVNHMNVYARYVKSNAYTKSGVKNKVEPVFHELRGKTWGLYGYGNIAKQVACVAKAFGCRVLVCKQTPVDECECVSLDELFSRSDIVSVHTPLTDKTKKSVNKNLLDKAKPNLVLVNAARGAVLDERDVTQAVLEGKIAGFGTDVYAVEPMQSDSPFQKLLNLDNVVFTPHMAWGAYEARARLLEEMCKNIRSFLAGEKRYRIV